MVTNKNFHGFQIIRGEDTDRLPKAQGQREPVHRGPVALRGREAGALGGSVVLRRPLPGITQSSRFTSQPSESSCMPVEARGRCGPGRPLDANSTRLFDIAANIVARYATPIDPG